ncbi:ANM_HP_G0242950.mRNA.1.CDS.1 [Saccharomyces cerevisiae]|nr:ANM_HP_G0242950.mRNA.1.CDS.1 [Saccharomyces cerevisiae]CAI7002536.1 ANM_HP_G0242950.mRNA.1.CDS.1 [Saccharomyces cerevisiae]
MNNPNERLVIKGYMKNACETEKGIKFLGVGLANYIIDELYDDSVGKSHLLVIPWTKYPYFFKKVEPINFISLAITILGIATSTPNYVKMSLSMGIIGTTGQELGLKDGNYGDKPLLYLLSEESLISVLARFKRRTLYANAVNDGISSLIFLYFLDYSGFETGRSNYGIL